MIINPPCTITARLMAGLRIGENSFISIYRHGVSDDGRTIYGYYIDRPEGEYQAADLKSGVGGGSLQGGLASLLCFLSASMEGYEYEQRTGRKSDNADLFPNDVLEWALQNRYELEAYQNDLEELEGVIVE